MQDITIDEFLLKQENFLPIDVRSPIEYKKASIPQAVNIPLFTDEERVEIGTIYKTQGKRKAEWRAMEIVSPKIPTLMKEIAVISTHRKPLIYCWRGGKRSQAFATFATFSGLTVSRLIGGYRAYRQSIVEQSNISLLPGRAVVLHGRTGVGKTQLLHELERRGYPTLDLEKLAEHRGSVFGDIGTSPQNQKTFDAHLFHRLRELNERYTSHQERVPYFFMEAESKRIGRVIQPSYLLEAKQAGLHVFLEAPPSVRIKRLYEEYVLPYQQEPWFQAKCTEAVTRLKKKIPAPLFEMILEAIDQEDYLTGIDYLITHYYDPRYDFKRSDYIGVCEVIDASDIETAITQLEALVNKYYSMV